MILQEVILRTYARKLTVIQTAEILGISARHLRLIRQEYERFDFIQCFINEWAKIISRRVPIETVEDVLRLYRDESLKRKPHMKITVTNNKSYSGKSGIGIIL